MIWYGVILYIHIILYYIILYYIILYYIIAPLCGILINKFSCRTAIVIGGIITSSGYAASAFTDSLDITIVTAGILVGKTNSTSAENI